MAQLSDDCFAFGGKLLPLEDALARLKDVFPPVVETERVLLDRVAGRILADDLLAPIDVPAHDNSADRKSTRLNSSHMSESRMPSSA